MPDPMADLRPDQIAIFAPMFALFLLTLLVWLYMFARRIPFIQQLNLPDEELTGETLARLSPPAVTNPSDNLKNLFEMPVLFYALCLYLHGTATVDNVDVILAWGFVVFRYLHSLMHCTRNVVIIRFVLYAIASLALWGMMLRALFNLLAA